MSGTGTPRITQAQAVADMLLATKTAPRTIADLVGITGMHRDTVRGWATALTDVGLLRRSKRRQSGGLTDCFEFAG